MMVSRQFRAAQRDLRPVLERPIDLDGLKVGAGGVAKAEIRSAAGFQL